MPVYFELSKQKTDVSRILIVEGPDDAYFLEPILASLGANPDKVSVCLARGKDRIGEFLGLLLKSSSFTSGAVTGYAIVRDADDDYSSSEKEIHAALKSLGEPEVKVGEIAKRADGRDAGLYLFPGNKQPGDLETLCMQAATGHLRDLAEQYAALAPLPAHTDHLRKRQCQAYLAIASQPLCSGAGWAMSRGIFDVNSPSFHELKLFLTQFIGPS